MSSKTKGKEGKKALTKEEAAKKASSSKKVGCQKCACRKFVQVDTAGFCGRAGCGHSLFDHVN